MPIAPIAETQKVEKASFNFEDFKTAFRKIAFLISDPTNRAPVKLD